MFEGAGTGLCWAALPGPWHQELCSGLLGLKKLPGDILEPLLEEQGSAANSKLFVLHGLPRAQATFLVNILDGRPENNSAFPQGLKHSPSAGQQVRTWSQPLLTQGLSKVTLYGGRPRT